MGATDNTRSSQDQAIHLAGPENSRLFFSGPPRALTGSIPLVNSSADKQKIRSVAVSAGDLMGAAGLPLREFPFYARLGPGEQANISGRMMLDRKTPPGNYDVRITVAAFRIANQITATEPFRSLVTEQVRPSPDVQSDEQIEDYVRKVGSTVFHPCGTCRMGEDPRAVVDSRLRVRGIQGLRVIDASVMPTLTTGNTNAPTIMIGEKGAAMIKEDAAA